MLLGTIFWTFQTFKVQSTKFFFTPFSDIYIWPLCFSSLSGWTTYGNVSHRKVAYSFLKSLVSVLFLYFIILIDNPWYTLLSCQICGNGSSFFHWNHLGTDSIGSTSWPKYIKNSGVKLLFLFDMIYLIIIKQPKKCV